MNFDKTLSVVLIILLILAVSATIYIIVVPQKGEKFTEFYILGPDGKAGNYPTNLTLGASGNVIIGVVNHEYKNTTYKLMVKFDEKVIKEENITLSDGEKQEIPFSFKAVKKGENQKLEFLLYKLPNDKDVYRSLHLFVNVT